MESLEYLLVNGTLVKAGVEGKAAAGDTSESCQLENEILIQFRYVCVLCLDKMVPQVDVA